MMRYLLYLKQLWLRCFLLFAVVTLVTDDGFIFISKIV